MRNKKSNQPVESAEQQALERRVDAMLSTELPYNEPTVGKSTPPPAAKPKRHDSDAVTVGKHKQPTAPALPDRLLKTIGGKSTIKIIPAEPDAADENAAAPDKATDDKPPPKPTAKPAPSTQKVKANSDSDQLPDVLEDRETDSAVDDIVANEANTQLAVNDAIARRRATETEAQNHRGLLTVIFTSPWTWLIIIGTAGVVWAWYH